MAKLFALPAKPLPVASAAPAPLAYETVLNTPTAAAPPAATAAVALAKPASPPLTAADLKALFAAWNPKQAFTSRISKVHKVIKALYGQKFGADPMPKSETADSKCDTTFGEILPVGVAKALDPAHLNAAANEMLCDLGMGNGKVVVQAFLQFPNLKKLIGVELVRERYDNAARAVKLLATMIPGAKIATTATRVTMTVDGRVVELRYDNLLNCADCLESKCVLLEICAEEEHHKAGIREFLDRFSQGTRLLTYESMSSFYGNFNKSKWTYFAANDQYQTSWNHGDADGNGGHHFYLSYKAL